jgi:Tol biopolymer transport system component
MTAELKALTCAALAALVLAAPARAAAPGANGLIAFVRGGDVWIAKPDGTGQRVLIPGADAPAWSANGRNLAFDRGGEVWVARADGTDQRQVTSGGGANPTWSPAGDRLAFERDSAVWVTNVDGSGAVRIQTPVDEDGFFPTAREPDWSPDGTRLAVASHITFGPHPFIATVAPDGSGWTPVQEGSDDPEWAPSGDRLAVALSGEESHHAGMVVTAGETFVSPDAEVDQDGFVRWYTSRWPAWSPDGTTLVYQSDVDDTSPEGFDIWAYSFAGGSLRKLIAGAVEPDWQPLVRIKRGR